MALIDAPDSQNPAPPGDLVKESSAAAFAADVIELSAKVPVIVDFWAPWCKPCKQLGPMLEKLVAEMGGLVRMVKINIDENKDLAAQMQVRSIPAVYAFRDGRPVDTFTGALPESQIRAFIKRLAGNAKGPLPEALEAAATAIADGEAATAADIYSQILAQDPANGPAVGGLIRCAVSTGDLEGARQMASGLSDEVRKSADVAPALAALELAEKGGGDLEPLRARLAADEGDHQARYDLAEGLYAAGQAAEAVELLLELVRRDRTWNNEAARTLLLKFFDALGGADELTKSARRRLSSILFS